MRFLTRCWIFRACPTRLAVRRMKTSIMAHCFALRFSTVTAKRASGVAALLKDNTVLTPVLLVPALPEIAGTAIGERLLSDGATLISPTKVAWAHRLI